MFGFLRPPDIPEPVKPEDFTAEERRRYRDVAVNGDPMRDTRDRVAMDRLLTNSTREITGPTGAFTLAQRERADDMTGRAISQYMGQSTEFEERRRDQAEERLGVLESERRRDLDEYEQMKQAQIAAEEVAKKNFQSGLLRAGAGLLSVAAPGIGTIAKSFIGGGEQSKVPEYKAKVGYSSMTPEDRNLMFSDFLTSKRGGNMFGGTERPAPGFDELFMDDPYGTPVDETRLSVLGY